MSCPCPELELTRLQLAAVRASAEELTTLVHRLLAQVRAFPVQQSAADQDGMQPAALSNAGGGDR